ncbi:phage holin family protein [Eubacteriales bacterium OttesenSCG-928-A19]|nr:phage holin family protein [Eubacteriales bacterium OttesenSCG-928-A19]
MSDFFANSWAGIVKGAAAVGGFFMGLLGEWDAMLTVLACVMVVDYIMGVLVAVMHKSIKTESGGLSSAVGFKGLLRKVVIMLLVLVGAALDMVLGTPGSVWRSMVCLFFIANEALSILENAALAGVPFPEGLKNMLEQMKEQNNNNETGPEA